MSGSETPSAHVKSFNDIYNSPDSWDGDKLKPQARTAIEKIDFSLFNINEIEVVQQAEKLPEDLLVPILKDWMRRQDDVLSNINGSLVYTPTVSKARVEEFVQMICCPSKSCRQHLVVENILRTIAFGGEYAEGKSPYPLIDPNHLADGVIFFDSNVSSNPTFLLDFKEDTYFRSNPQAGAYIILGFPPFMKVRLTKYLMRTPPHIEGYKVHGGLKSWILYGSNDLIEIKSGNPFKIDEVSNDEKQKTDSKVVTYDVDLDDKKYFRYFKLQITGNTHHNNLSIMLSEIDFSGNIIITRD